MRTLDHATEAASSPLRIDLARVRHPRERQILILCAVGNLSLVGTAIAAILLAPHWIAAHPAAAAAAHEVQAIAALALLVLPVGSLVRLGKWRTVELNSIRIGSDQLPELQVVLERLCRTLGVAVPRLYLSTLPGVGVSNALARGRGGRRALIALGDQLFDGVGDVAARADVLAFFIGHELGRIVLGHASWWSDLLLGYLKRMPGLGLPLIRVQTYSRDRVAALLAPESVRALAMLASGGEIFDSINARAFLQAAVASSFPVSARLPAILRKQPHLAERVHELYRSGFLTLDGAPQA